MSSRESRQWPAANFLSPFLRHLERFLHVEAASGVVLLIAAVAALVWANSPFAAGYDALWHARIAFQLGGIAIDESLHFIINDALMAVFFLVVGMEIRREIHDGALADLRLAALPILAAAGGVLAPALIYLALNTAPEMRQGWAVPTATDIAFAVGVLALLGKRVPTSLRVLLLALAIIDDIIAILIIAFFYSSGVELFGLGMVALGVVLVLAWQALGFRSAWSYVLPGAVVWFGVLQAQVHPAIAGVLLGLLTPMHAAPGEPSAPAIRVQAALHPWVAFGIMPLFALANSGVNLESVSLGALLHEPVGLGVLLGLTIGKPLGITLASVLAIRLGLASLPPQANLRGIVLVGCLGGIGFTMAIFIANLAFASPALLGQAKLAVLLASAVSGMAGLLIGRLVLPRVAEGRSTA